MRETTTPEQIVWECFIEWEGRRAMHASTRKLRARREARARHTAENKKLDLLDGCDVLGFGDIPVLAAIAVVTLLAVLFGPWLYALLFAVVELGAIVLLLSAGYVARTMFRRPWRVVAVSHEGVTWAWRQVGLRASRSLVDEISTKLQLGHEPSLIARAKLEEVNPTQVDKDAPLGLMAHGYYRWGSRLVIVLAIVVSLVTIAVRLGQ